MEPELQRMLWLAAEEFDEDGDAFRKQEKRNAATSWELGLERDGDSVVFARTYMNWCAS